MEPEKIGILDLVNMVHSKPSRFAEPIAKMTLKMVVQDLQKRVKLWERLSVAEIMASANQHPTAEQIQALKTIVTHLIREHATGKLPEWINIESATRDIVARACMPLLADQLHSKWHVELAHYIHNTPHIQQILLQPERLQMLEYWIIPDNRILGPSDAGNNQLWIGHDAKKKYAGKEKARIPNIIVWLQRTDENTTFQVSPILIWDRIHIASSQILVFQWEKILVHETPQKKDAKYESSLLTSFDHDLDKIDNIESFGLERTPWQMYRITGKKHQTGDGTSEEGSIVKSVTIAINQEKPDLSYITSSKRYKIGKQWFTIDRDSEKIIFLNADGLQRIKFKFQHVYGIHKYKGQEALYFTDGALKKKKMKIKDGEVVFEDTEDEENEFFGK